MDIFADMLPRFGKALLLIVIFLIVVGIFNEFLERKELQYCKSQYDNIRYKAEIGKALTGEELDCLDKLSK